MCAGFSCDGERSGWTRTPGVEKMVEMWSPGKVEFM
jgi:hypothetical protein